MCVIYIPRHVLTGTLPHKLSQKMICQNHTANVAFFKQMPTSFQRGFQESLWQNSSNEDMLGGWQLISSTTLSFLGERKSHVSHTEQTSYWRAIASSFLHTINTSSSSILLGFSKHAVGMLYNVPILPCWRRCTIRSGFRPICRSYLIGHMTAEHWRAEDGVAPHIFWQDIATARC